MLDEVIRVLTVAREQGRRHYPSTLFAQAEAEPGLVVCRADRETPLGEGHRALPWQLFPAWLGKRLAER